MTEPRVTTAFMVLGVVACLGFVAKGVARTVEVLAPTTVAVEVNPTPGFTYSGKNLETDDRLWAFERAPAEIAVAFRQSADGGYRLQIYDPTALTIIGPDGGQWGPK